MITEILNEGRIKSIASSTGKGTTKEAHLAVYKNRKYLLRICRDEETAERYKGFYKKFKRFGFLPELLESQGRYLLFEFIEGRDCGEKENEDIIRQIGKICAIINKVRADYDYEAGLIRKLKAIREKEILSSEKINEIESFYRKSKVKLKTSLDAGDVTHDNFRVSGKKVYFVDIEAIKPNIKGFGIAKSFSSWFKTEEERKMFEKGYSSVSPMGFFNEDYRDLCTLIFLVHRINFKFDQGDHKLVRTSINKLERILSK